MSKSVLVRYCMAASVVALVAGAGLSTGCEKKAEPAKTTPPPPPPPPAEKK
jgi:hypothetical protein